MVQGIIGPVRLIRHIKAAEPNRCGDWYHLAIEVVVYYAIIRGELVPFLTVELASAALLRE